MWKRNVAAGGACLVAVLAAWHLAVGTVEVRERSVAAFRAPEAWVRAAALSAAVREHGAGGAPPPVAALVARVSDVDDDVRARALEAFYRTGQVPALLAPGASRAREEVQRAALEAPEFTARWAVAVLTALDFETGFCAAADRLRTFRSPWSRPFLLQVLAREAEEAPAARALLAREAASDGGRAPLARDALAWLERPRNERFEGYVPAELRLPGH